MTHPPNEMPLSRERRLRPVKLAQCFRAARRLQRQLGADELQFND
jgi:hypothetical protein